jgi:hypothetical protein
VPALDLNSAIVRRLGGPEEIRDDIGAVIDFNAYSMWLPGTKSDQRYVLQRCSRHLEFHDGVITLRSA